MRVCPNCQTYYPKDDPFCSKDGRETVKAEADSADSLPLIGTHIGNYKITSLLGEGGMGMVFRAEHTALGRVAAIKVLHEEFARRGDAVERFFTEARAVNQIRHENIVDVIDFGFLPGPRPYFIMEYLEGTDLDRYLKQHKRLSLEEAAEIMMPVLSALQAAHDEGIIHRDLKPENIFLAERKHGGRTVKLLDFGIAKLLAEKETVYKTRTGALIGTPSYMSPEQASGQSDLDARADIYAAGIILYEMLVGEPPFTGKTVLEIVHKQWMEKPVPPRKKRPDLPEKINYLILRALEKKPDKRVQTASEFAERLISAFPQRVAASLRTSFPTPSGTWKSARPSRPSAPSPPAQENEKTQEKTRPSDPMPIFAPETREDPPLEAAPAPSAAAPPGKDKTQSLLLEDVVEILEEDVEEDGGTAAPGGETQSTPPLPEAAEAAPFPPGAPPERFEEPPSAFRTTLSGSTGEILLEPEELRRMTAPPRWIWGVGAVVAVFLVLGAALLLLPGGSPASDPASAALHTNKEAPSAAPVAPSPALPEKKTAAPQEASTLPKIIPPPEPFSLPTEEADEKRDKAQASKNQENAKGDRNPRPPRETGRDSQGGSVEALIPPIRN